MRNAYNYSRPPRNVLSYYDKSQMKFLTILFCLLLPTLVQAETSDQLLTITKSGYYLTVVTADVPVYVKLINVIDLTSSSPTPNPTPTPTPNPKFDMELVKNVQTWAKVANDPQASQGIAAAYSTIRKANLESPWVVLKGATDQAITLLESKEDWETFRKNLSAVLTERSQKGTLNNEQFLHSVQQGLEMSADGSVALPTDTLTKIISNTEALINASK